MFDLHGKVALVTGATGGIGLEIVREFAAAGATVIASGRDVTKLEAIVGAYGIRPKNQDDKGVCHTPLQAIAADLSAPGEADRLVRETVERAGRLDILVNNAGITRDMLLMRMKDDDFDAVLNTNLRSAFQMCRAAMMPMMKNKFGRIINMASIIGYIGGPGQANYAASKGAIIAMTKSIAAEVASRNITANCIAPGFIKTPMTDVLPDEVRDTYLKQIPAGRFGEPADVAAAALFLASDESAYITGQTIHVNGGMGRF